MNTVPRKVLALLLHQPAGPPASALSAFGPTLGGASSVLPLPSKVDNVRSIQTNCYDGSSGSILVSDINLPAGSCSKACECNTYPRPWARAAWQPFSSSSRSSFCSAASASAADAAFNGQTLRQARLDSTPAPVLGAQDTTSLKQQFAMDSDRQAAEAEGLARTQRNLALAFTCKRCNTRSVKTFSRQSYEKGVVIITCPGCRNKHLVADNLGWFDEQPFRIEQLLKEHGLLAGASEHVHSEASRAAMVHTSADKAKDGRVLGVHNGITVPAGEQPSPVTGEDVAAWARVQQLKQEREESMGVSTPAAASSLLGSSADPLTPIFDRIASLWGGSAAAVAAAATSGGSKAATGGIGGGTQSGETGGGGLGSPEGEPGSVQLNPAAGGVDFKVDSVPAVADGVLEVNKSDIEAWAKVQQHSSSTCSGSKL